MTRSATHVSSPAAATSSNPGMSVDEELWFGTLDGEAAERAAAQSMAAVVGKIYGAKPFPKAARRLAELSSREATPLHLFVEVLEQDPALSAKLLRLVNSAGFGLRQRCTSIRHAVTLVGSRQLNQIATTAAVLDMFDSDSRLSVELLEHCTVVSAFCRYLGTHLSLPVDDLFTAGALHDIGKLMLLDTFGEQYALLVESQLGKADTLHALERAKYGYDHGVLAAHVLKAWNIPDPIPKLVAWHHEPGRAYASSSLMASQVQTLRLADRLACAMASGAPRTEVAEIARQDAARYLEISEAQLDALWPELSLLRARALDRDVVEADGSSEEISNTRVRASSRPMAKAPPAAKSPAVPQQFPCAECGSPSYGTTCPACKGYTCPEHPPEASSGWCGLCTQEYQQFAKETPFPIDRRTGAIVASVFTVLATALGGLAGNAGMLRGFLLGLVVSLVGVGAVAVAKRSYLRARFLRLRPPRVAK